MNPHPAVVRFHDRAAVLERWCAAEDAKPAGRACRQVSFYRDIRPIFQDRCQGCHQPAKALGGLVMTSYAADQKRGREWRGGIRAWQAR